MLSAKSDKLALSHELDFVARHWDTICEILAGTLQVSEELQRLTKRVDEWGHKDGKDLINHAGKTLISGIQGTARIDWNKRGANDLWQLEGRVYKAYGKKRLAWSGLSILDQREKTPRFIGWYFPPGGIVGRRDLVAAANKSLGTAPNKASDPVYLSDRREDFPGWTRVIWFDQQLNRKITIGELDELICCRAKAFFKIAVAAGNQ